MSPPADEEVPSDDELQEPELEQRQLDLDRELKQRQLDLDRKKIEIRKRRAKMPGPVDLTSDDGKTHIKAERTNERQTEEPPTQMRVSLPSPAPTEAMQTSTASSTCKEQDQISSLVQPRHFDEQAAQANPFTPVRLISRLEAQSMCSPPSSTASKMPSLTMLLTARQDRLVSQVSPRTVSAMSSPWQKDSTGFLPTSASLKRSLMTDIKGTGHVLEEGQTIEVKRPKLKTNNDYESQGARTKQQPAVVINERERSAIIRQYGHRLVEIRMLKLHNHDHDLFKHLKQAGSKIVDGLIVKKFKSLEELHDAYEDQLHATCRRGFPKDALFKFRRAAAVWWPECLKKKYQQQRMEFVMTVFEDVKAGKYDSSYMLRQKSPVSLRKPVQHSPQQSPWYSPQQSPSWT